jgi:hypothetical protein
MRRMLLPAALAALALAVAPPAVAKEITKAEVCGPEGCVSVDDEAGRMALMSGGSPIDPPRAAPYYEVRARVDHGDEHAEIRLAVVPSRDAVRYDDGNWYSMPAEMVALVRKTTAESAPFPATGLAGAAATPAPQPQPATPAADDGGNLLWPEGVLIALALGVAGVFLVRAARSSRRFGPAGSA